MTALKDYKDRAYITFLLCQLSYDFYSTIYNISLLPTLLGSSILTILNSSEINNDILKKVNIVVNGTNTLILALVNGYKLTDRINTFNNSKIKFNKLNHLIESITNKHIDKEIDKQIIENIINEYDLLFNDIKYQFPCHIKRKITKKFGGIRTLPNGLEIDYNDSLKKEIKADIVQNIV